MRELSAKNKILILCAAWLMLSASMFLFFFGILDKSNQQTLDGMTQDRTTLAALQSEDTSFKQAENDLKQIAADPDQPENFFSRDVTFVNEIQTLEDLATKYNVTMGLGGVNGTINSLPAAPTASSLAIVPYTISLTGSLVNVVNYMENMENLNFVTNIDAVSLSGAGQGMVNLGLGANFYLRRQ